MKASSPGRGSSTGWPILEPEDRLPASANPLSSRIDVDLACLEGIPMKSWFMNFSCCPTILFFTTQVALLLTYAASAQTPAPAAPAALPPPTVTEEFKPLFDGKTLTGWTNPYTYGKAEVVNGEIRLTADKKFFLCTEKSYANFIFEGQVHLPRDKANSGFMFRARVSPGSVTGYQAEVDGDITRMWSGGIYDEGLRMWFTSPKKGDAGSEAAFKLRAAGAFKRDEWNTYRITCIGHKLKIEVNGVTTTEITDDRDARGPIGIQHHGEKGATYRFRNLKIKELP